MGLFLLFFSFYRYKTTGCVIFGCIMDASLIMKDHSMLKTLKSYYADSTIAYIQARVADLGSIHAAKAQLGWGDADYRSMVKAACGARSDSSADLNARERARLIRAMKAKGYVESAALSGRSLKIKKNRLKDLGVIHVGKRALGLNDMAYRDLVDKASGGVARSSGLLKAPERALVLGEMKKMGFEFNAR